MATTNGSKDQTRTTTGRRSRTGAAATGQSAADTNGRGAAGANGAAEANGGGTKARAAKTKSAATTRTRRKTAAASSVGATARARIDHGESTPNGPTRAPSNPPQGEPAERVLDLSRLAWFRTQVSQMEQQQRERLVKVAQLTAIAVVFITFVLQNAAGVNVHFLLFSVNIRLIWVIFGCGLLGGVAGYLIGRPDKSLKALVPQKVRRASRGRFPRKAA